jgi:predicted O-methyltransferase YrrM
MNVIPTATTAALRTLMGRCTSAHWPTWMQPEADWAMMPCTRFLIFMLIDANALSSVLEFGAGQSSLAAARGLEALGGGCLTSVDNAPEYARHAWTSVERCPNVKASLVQAGLHLRLRRSGLLYEYGQMAEALSPRAPFDLVVIDGPPGVYGRDACLDIAWPYLRDGALILLDDYNRPREQTTVRRWMARYPSLRPVCLDVGFGRGVAVLQHRDGPWRWSLRNYVGSLHDYFHYRRNRALFRHACQSPEMSGRFATQDANHSAQ